MHILLSLYMYLHVSICLSYLSIYLSIFLSIYLPIHLPIYYIFGLHTCIFYFFDSAIQGYIPHLFLFKYCYTFLFFSHASFSIKGLFKIHGSIAFFPLLSSIHVHLSFSRFVIYFYFSFVSIQLNKIIPLDLLLLDS